MIRLKGLFSNIALGTVFALAIAGCNKKAPAAAPAPPPPPPAAPVTPPPPPPPPAPRPAPAPAPRALSEDEVFSQKSVDQLNAEHLLSDSFFELDKSDISDEAKPVLQKDADWLKRWKSVQVTVEGHCDSRGSAEYNLGLGSRRANAIRDYLVSLGVQTTQLTVISKGKEAPLCSEEVESCWRQNRRGHFVITGK
ncbi:MAG TPA: OmpA family protein [Vicinamibacterales bacterium]